MKNSRRGPRTGHLPGLTRLRKTDVVESVNDRLRRQSPTQPASWGVPQSRGRLLTQISRHTMLTPVSVADVVSRSLPATTLMQIGIVAAAHCAACQDRAADRCAPRRPPGRLTARIPFTTETITRVTIVSWGTPRHNPAEPVTGSRRLIDVDVAPRYPTRPGLSGKCCAGATKPGCSSTSLSTPLSSHRSGVAVDRLRPPSFSGRAVTPRFLSQ